MLSITEHSTGVLEMTLHDLIDANDVSNLEIALDPYLPDEGSISAVFDMTDARDSSGKTLAQDDHVAERLHCQFDKLGRIAVISPSADLQGVVKAVDGLMPRGTMARFRPDDHKAARKFASGLF